MRTQNTRRIRFPKAIGSSCFPFSRNTGPPVFLHPLPLLPLSCPFPSLHALRPFGKERIGESPSGRKLGSWNQKQFQLGMQISPCASLHPSYAALQFIVLPTFHWRMHHLQAKPHGSPSNRNQGWKGEAAHIAHQPSIHLSGVFRVQSQSLNQRTSGWESTNRSSHPPPALYGWQRPHGEVKAPASGHPAELRPEFKLRRHQLLVLSTAPCGLRKVPMME